MNGTINTEVRRQDEVTLIGRIEPPIDDERDPVRIEPSRSGGEVARLRVRVVTPGYTFERDGEQRSVEDKTRWLSVRVVGKAVDDVRGLAAETPIAVHGRVDVWYPAQSHRPVYSVTAFRVEHGDAVDLSAAREPNVVRIDGRIVEAGRFVGRGGDVDSVQYKIETYGREPRVMEIHEYGAQSRASLALRTVGSEVHVEGKLSHVKFPGRNGVVDSYFISTSPDQTQVIDRTAQRAHEQQQGEAFKQFVGEYFPPAQEGDVRQAVGELLVRPNVGSESELVNRRHYDRATVEKLVREGLDRNATVARLGEALALFDDVPGYAEAVERFNRNGYRDAATWLREVSSNSQVMGTVYDPGRAAAVESTPTLPVVEPKGAIFDAGLLKGCASARVFGMSADGKEIFARMGPFVISFDRDAYAGELPALDAAVEMRPDRSFGPIEPQSETAQERQAERSTIEIE